MRKETRGKHLIQVLGDDTCFMEERSVCLCAYIVMYFSAFSVSVSARELAHACLQSVYFTVALTSHPETH